MSVAKQTDTFVKFHANQAGPYNSDNNVIDVTLPGGAVYNLRDSYLQVYAEITTTEDPADIPPSGTAGVYKCLAKLVNTTGHFPNACLIKNAESSCSARGSIESIRRADILAQCKDTVAKSRRAKQTENVLQCNNVIDPNGNVRESPFLQTRKLGTVKSSQQEIPIPIRLGDVMESCETLLYDGRKLGDLRFRFELNAPGGANPVVEAFCADDGATAAFGAWRQLANIPDPGGALASVTQLASRMFSDTAAAADARALVPLGSSPWYVGQKVKITGTGVDDGAGAAPADIDADVVITGISASAAGVYTYTFSDNILPAPLANQQSYNNIIIAQINGPQTATISFNRVELVAKRIGAPPPMSMPIQWAWRTYHTTEDVGPTGVRPFNRQYIMEPESDCVLITFPHDDDITSINGDITSYRLAVNQVQTTDRDVVVGPDALTVSPLAYDRLSDMWGKMGYQLEDLTLNQGDSSAVATGAVYSDAALRQTMFGCKLPQMAQAKTLGIKVNLQANEVNKIALFQSQPRGFEY